MTVFAASKPVRAGFKLGGLHSRQTKPFVRPSYENEVVHVSPGPLTTIRELFVTSHSLDATHQQRVDADRAQSITINPNCPHSCQDLSHARTCLDHVPGLPLSILDDQRLRQLPEFPPRPFRLNMINTSFIHL